MLIDVADETAADLVLVGSHGVGRVRGALLGTVSSQILSHAACSVMVFREHAASTPPNQVRSVVVGVDGSAASLGALRLADAIAHSLGARLVLLHACRPADRDAARAMLREARAGVAAGASIDEEVVEGDPRESLLAACERHGPSLLVVGKHASGGLARPLHGATSWSVASHAPCPVVVFRAPA